MNEQDFRFALIRWLRIICFLMTILIVVLMFSLHGDTVGNIALIVAAGAWLVWFIFRPVHRVE